MGIIGRYRRYPMQRSKPDHQIRRQDPDEILRQLRARVLGGGRPALEDLEGEEMAAAGKLISQGEAQVFYAACRLHLGAKLKD